MPVGAVTRITVRFPYKSPTSYGPYSENTFWVTQRGDATGDETQAAVTTDLHEFYTISANDEDAGITDYMSSQLVGVATIRAEVYDNGVFIGGTDLPGFTFTPQPGDSLPAQVASCMTVKCLPHEAVSVRQSLANRIYIGPLGDICSSTNGLGEARPSQIFREAVVAASRRLYINPTDDAARFVVYSTKHASWGDAAEGFMDDVFDTQRKRYDAVTVHTRWGEEP